MSDSLRDRNKEISNRYK